MQQQQQKKVQHWGTVNILITRSRYFPLQYEDGPPAVPNNQPDIRQQKTYSPWNAGTYPECTVEYIFLFPNSKQVCLVTLIDHLSFISDNLSWKLAQVFRPPPEKWNVPRYRLQHIAGEESNHRAKYHQHARRQNHLSSFIPPWRKRTSWDYRVLRLMHCFAL